MLEVLCGLLLFGAGYLFGSGKKTTAKPAELTAEQERAEKEYREQIDSLLKFNGRRGKTNG